jgi:hypothetical protein
VGIENTVKMDAQGVNSGYRILASVLTLDGEDSCSSINRLARKKNTHTIHSIWSIRFAFFR